MPVRENPSLPPSTWIPGVVAAVAVVALLVAGAFGDGDGMQAASPAAVNPQIAPEESSSEEEQAVSALASAPTIRAFVKGVI